MEKEIEMMTEQEMREELKKREQKVKELYEEKEEIEEIITKLKRKLLFEEYHIGKINDLSDNAWEEIHKEERLLNK